VPNPNDPNDRASGSDREALDRLIPLVYRQLHRIAQAYLRRESRHQTLQPTALIHEAYLRLAEYGPADYQDRAHLFGIAARVMRQVLVDRARARNAAKRGFDVEVPLPWPPDVPQERSSVVTALDDALQALAIEDEKMARLVELRFFGGLTAQEISECVGVPVHTVRRRLRAAQAWLRREIESDGLARGAAGGSHL
jgi:RNA polymerase sigma-70 factor, ECF subfamily